MDGAPHLLSKRRRLSSSNWSTATCLLFLRSRLLSSSPWQSVTAQILQVATFDSEDPKPAPTWGSLTYYSSPPTLIPSMCVRGSRFST
jgi:hypothetical protein